MKHLEGYRSGSENLRWVEAIRKAATRRWTLMEVCGGQTHTILRHGIHELVPEMDLLHGPGCPVCVTPAASIDLAIDHAFRPGTTLMTFGDMLRVPGTKISLADARAQGATVKMVYSPLDAVTFAQRNPDTTVVFFAVGFETTAPTTALAVQTADALMLSNFLVLCSHVRVPPAMASLLEAPDGRIDAFLAAGHVCTVMGLSEYEALVARFRVPVVVTGFEPMDILQGMYLAVRQLEQGEARVENQYARVAGRSGNRRARAALDAVFEVTDLEWRGLGTIHAGGFRFRPAFHRFDAHSLGRLPTVAVPHDASPCLSAQVLQGRIKPPDCPSFGKACTPDHPLGAAMVSSEGACAAYHRYAGIESSW